jgi:hypothetical protein
LAPAAPPAALPAAVPASLDPYAIALLRKLKRERALAEAEQLEVAERAVPSHHVNWVNVNHDQLLQQAKFPVEYQDARVSFLTRTTKQSDRTLYEGVVASDIQVSTTMQATRALTPTHREDRSFSAGAKFSPRTKLITRRIRWGWFFWVLRV